MDFSLTEAQVAAQDMAHEFAERKLTEEVARRIHETREMPDDIITGLFQANLLGMVIPEEYGGAGCDYFSYILAQIELAKACGSTSVFHTVQNSLVYPVLLQYGTAWQKENFLPRLAKREIGSFSLTTADHGTDAAHITTRYRLDGDRAIINGGKIFVSCASKANLFIIFANLQGSSDYHDMRAFIIERHTPGFEVAHEEKKLGIRASGSSVLHIEDAVVPLTHMVGNQENHGYKIFLSVIDGGRIGIAGQAQGFAEKALDLALKYGSERRQFNKRIIDFDTQRARIARMRMVIEQSRLLIYRACWLKMQGQPFTEAAAAAKIAASEAADMAIGSARKMHGGCGFMEEFPITLLHCNYPITQIYEGTNDVLEFLIAQATLTAHGIPVKDPEAKK